MAKTATKSKLVKRGPGVGKNGNLIPARKGEPSRGRKKGTPNGLTRDIKDAIIRAAELSEHSKTEDLVGYMVHLANKKQETFAGLLGRLIPLQAKVTHTQAVDVNLTLNMPLSDMISSFEQHIKAAAVPRVAAAPLLIEQGDVDVDA